jgi:hypothetical protein
LDASKRLGAFPACAAVRMPSAAPTQGIRREVVMGCVVHDQDLRRGGNPVRSEQIVDRERPLSSRQGDNHPECAEEGTSFQHIKLIDS